MAALFPLGRIMATPGALSLLAATYTDPAELLARHQGGDWGEISPEDARENAHSLKVWLARDELLPRGRGQRREGLGYHGGRQVEHLRPPARGLLIVPVERRARGPSGGRRKDDGTDRGSATRSPSSSDGLGSTRPAIHSFRSRRSFCFITPTRRDPPAVAR